MGDDYCDGYYDRYGFGMGNGGGYGYGFGNGVGVGYGFGNGNGDGFGYGGHDGDGGDKVIVSPVPKVTYE